jgi:hypothetical protein
LSADIKVVQVPEGSVLLLTGMAFAADDDGSGIARLSEAIEAAVGHRQFVTIVSDVDGDIEVWGPDVDLKAKVEQLLGRSTASE